MRCTACGSEVPPDGRFCPSCAHPTAAPQAEERRIVTVLFADIVGFTGLAERMDPEQVKRLVDECFERLVEVVTEFGGGVDKILGDGMLVLFGAPVAHEDDPERAVRAALKMQQTVEHFGETSPLVGDDVVRMRIGINTGEVLVGTLAGTDYTAMGDVVNTASRLQGAAPPGGVVVGETTHHLTAHVVRYEPLGDMQARGREQSVAAWLAVEPTARPGAARPRRREVPMVGRQAEMAIARAVFDLVTRTDRGAVLHVNGENGVGKTRLLDEVLGQVSANDEMFLLEGTCLPYGESNVWWPMATALSTYLDLDPALDGDQARDAVRNHAREVFPWVSETDATRLVEVVMHLLGYPSEIDTMEPAHAKATIHRFVGRVFDARAEEHLMVLRIDDLHWADPMLLDLLEHLVLTAGRRRFVLVTSMRPGADVAWPPQSDRTSTLSITLQPLDRAATDELVSSLFDEQPSASLLDAMYERSGGNPLFAHELVALRQVGGGRDDLPDSLRTLIAARLDQLTPDQRQVIENAAVLGTSGTIAALERFATQMGQTLVLHTFRELEELGLLDVRGRRWTFRSESVRDAAYQTLTKAARARRHAGVALTLSGAGLLDDRAHHAAMAAELVAELGAVDGVPTDIADTAIELLGKAAAKAAESGSLRMAVRHATRALDFAENRPVPTLQLATLLLVRATANTQKRNFDAASTDIAALQSMALQLGDRTLEAQAYRLRGSLSQMAGRMDDARRDLGEAVALLRSGPRTDLLAQALRVRGFIEVFGGSLQDAEWFFGEAETLYQTLGDERGLAYVEQHRAWIAFFSGDLVTARERLDRAATTHERVGDRTGVDWALGLLAFVEFIERDLEAAEELAHRVAEDAAQRGDDWAVGMMEALLADLRLWQGRLHDAATYAETARGRFKKLADRFGMIQALAPLIRAQIALGRTAAAMRTGEELLAQGGSGVTGFYPALTVAGAAMHRGNGAIAVDLAAKALAAMNELGMSGPASATGEALLVMAVGQVQLGQVDDALVTIAGLGDGTGHHPFALAASAIVDAAAGRTAEALTLADAVAHADGATYLDQVLAYVAAAGAAARTGDEEHASLAAEAAVARAIGVGDVMAIGLATAMYEAVTGRVHPAHDEHTVIGDGWANVVRLVTAGRSTGE